MNDIHQEQLAALRHKIEEVRFGMLTTIAPDHSLSSRPMTSQQIDAQGRLWFFTSDESGFARHLMAEPTVNVTFSDPDDSLYISVSGRAMLLKNRAKTEELWNPMVSAWFPEGIDDPHLALISVDIHGRILGLCIQQDDATGRNGERHTDRYTPDRRRRTCDVETVIACSKKKHRRPEESPVLFYLPIFIMRVASPQYAV